MKVPFLMFHSIGASGPPGYRFPTEEFRAFLAYLREGGVRTLTLKDYLSEREEGESARTSVLLTFDDGWRDNLSVVWPLLEEFGFRASFFPAVSLVETEGMMGWEDLRRLAAAGMEIGSHGMSHDLLAGKSEERLLRELEESKRRLEGEFGIEAAFFSLPRGYLPPALPDLARRAGYRGLCASRAGYNSVSTDPFRWRRFPVRSSMTAADLRAIVERRGARLAKIFIGEKAREALRIRRRWSWFR
ncbi:MAG: polysaccharide deacetylase family protein [Candidatus Aureabacteria bacterium]|nr:polysaccharide deacetylase family protein [Candidatus Auribacterota bacterium]